MDVKSIRKSLGLSARQFSKLIGYNDDRTIRRIESGERSLSGSAEKVLTYIMQGVDINFPEHLVCTPAIRDDELFGSAEIIFRTHRPRFLATVGDPIEGLESISLAAGAEYITIFMWIDDPDGFDVDDLLRRAATDFEIYTQDSFDL